jgi:DNA invertase Pin-like site-specific DNA recombinase
MERVKQERDLDYVIVHKVDRLARNRYHDATISYTLQAGGIELVSVTENIDDTPFGRFMHAIVAANAEFYSANSPRRHARDSSKRQRPAAPPPARRSATSTSER